MIYVHKDMLIIGPQTKNIITLSGLTEGSEIIDGPVKIKVNSILKCNQCYRAFFCTKNNMFYTFILHKNNIIHFQYDTLPKTNVDTLYKKWQSGVMFPIIKNGLMLRNLEKITSDEIFFKIEAEEYSSVLVNNILLLS